MQSPLYLPRKKPSPASYDQSTHPQIINFDIPSLHSQSLYYSPSQFDFSIEMYGVHGNLFSDATATDMVDQDISTMTYDELESQASSSPGRFMQNSSPGELDPSAFFLEDRTTQPEDFFLDTSLSMMQSLPNQIQLTQLTQEEASIINLEETQAMSTLNEIPICWDHDCNGKVFSSWSNLRRHQRERASQAPKCFCPRCGAHFSRTTARNQHLANMSCKRIRRYSNGRVRPSTQKIQETYGTQL